MKAAQIIEKIKNYAALHCDHMEGANLPEFIEHEHKMIAAIEILEQLGIKYDPITGKTQPHP